MEQAAKLGDVFAPLTGDINKAIREEHFLLMKDGAILSNSGHFNVEIDIPALERLFSTARRQIRDAVEEFTLKNGTCFMCWASSVSLVNLARCRRTPLGCHGYELRHQALSAEFICQNHQKFARQVYPVPEDIDKRNRPVKTGGDAGGYRQC